MVWGRFGWVIWSWFVFRILSFAFILNICNISTIGISNRVCDDLSTTIRKVYTVFTIGGITITIFISSKVRS